MTVEKLLEVWCFGWKILEVDFVTKRFDMSTCLMWLQRLYLSTDHRGFGESYHMYLSTDMSWLYLCQNHITSVIPDLRMLVLTLVVSGMF